VALEAASWPRRMLALAVDWFACTLILIFFVGSDVWLDGDWTNFVVLGIFVVESALLTATVGGSFGQVATRLRVVRANGDPRPVDLLPALGRQLLVGLVIPPLV
ncbi:RDD family protein, partial [Klebsiella pneumoniae]|nr:RDD family protein [Klebsiella pneumoniae]